MGASSKPEGRDVVIRHDMRGGLPVYILHTAEFPEQLVVRSRDAALQQAQRFAKRERVRVWTKNGDNDFTLIDDFSAMKRTIERLRGEFMEMPGLRLTPRQVQRLCGVDATMCQQLLDALVDLKFLRMNIDGTYARFSDGRPSPTKHSKK